MGCLNCVGQNQRLTPAIYPASSYVKEVDGTTTTIKKTYSAGSTSIAVRTIINGTEDTLNWLLSDHLGSASITTTADGTWFSELRYSAFGETRYSSGITSTDYRYTGQLEQADLNLYYYNARFYDPALGRFVQSDTVIPDFYNIQDWDRYAYVRNNPLIYTDPNGHDADCGISERCRVSSTNEIKRAIKQYYKIEVSSKFNLKEMKTIYNALGEMETGLNKITNNNGLKWIQKNFQDTHIELQTEFRKTIFKGSAHVLGSKVYLPTCFSEHPWDSIDGTVRSLIIHEFGHVFDNRSHSGLIDASIWGGGYGDALMDLIGGKSNGPLSLRYTGGFDVYQYYKYPTDNKGLNYGNNSTADYFAHTFNAAIIKPDVIPSSLTKYWMAAMIDLTK